MSNILKTSLVGFGGLLFLITPFSATAQSCDRYGASPAYVAPAYAAPYSGYYGYSAPAYPAPGYGAYAYSYPSRDRGWYERREWQEHREHEWREHERREHDWRGRDHERWGR